MVLYGFHICFLYYICFNSLLYHQVDSHGNSKLLFAKHGKCTCCATNPPPINPILIIFHCSNSVLLYYLTECASYGPHPYNILTKRLMCPLILIGRIINMLFSPLLVFLMFFVSVILFAINVLLIYSHLLFGSFDSLCIVIKSITLIFYPR